MSATGGRIPATKSPVIANLGIKLERDGRVYLAAARMPDGTLIPAEQRVQAPRLPSALLESACGMIRAFWRRHHRCIGVLLYLDVEHREWSAYVPPQTVAPNDIQVRCDFRGFHVPPERLRLAGSIRSWPSTIGLAPELFVMPRDGLHILVSPHNPWIHILGFLCVGGNIVKASIEQLIADEHDAMLGTIGPRIQFAEVL